MILVCHEVRKFTAVPEKKKAETESYPEQDDSESTQSRFNL